VSEFTGVVAAATRSRIPAGTFVRVLVGSIALAGAYYGTARGEYALALAGPVAAVMWLPVGVGIAFLTIGGLQFWPGILAGDLLANDYSAMPFGSALGQTCGNVLEVVVAVVILRRLTRGASALASVRGIVSMLVAIAVGTALSATMGATSLALGGVVAPHAVPTVWRTWWLGDSIGALVVVPVALAWYELPSWACWWRRQGLETAFLLCAVAAVSELALDHLRSLTYLVFPTLIWAALRLGQRGASLAIAVAAFCAGGDTMFDSSSITRHVLVTQLYIAVSAVSALLLAAVATERETFAEEVHRSRTRLVEAADRERRRIERDLHDGVQQRLTALTYKLQRVGERAPYPFIAEAEADVQLAIDELREIAHGVRPSALADLGLVGAVRSIAARSTVPITFVELLAGRLDDTAETTAYHVVAEAVTNVHKHARASAIVVRIWMSHRFLHVTIDDDGVGGTAETDGSGLQGLRDRVEAVSGTFLVTEAAPRGTRVTAVIPATARTS
jgi:signal transduction histidine kinase